MKLRLYRKSTSQAVQPFETLLGTLEVRIMDILWNRNGHGTTTVREVVTRLNEGQQRPVAYTTVMTVMTRLVEKGLLKRTLVGKTHHYEPALSREQFLRRFSGDIVEALVADFGDVAIAQFMEEIERLAPEKIEQLRRLAHGEEDA